MQVDVEAFDLDRLAHADAGQDVHQDENDEGGERRPRNGRGNAFDLRPDLADIAFQRPFGPADRLDREYAGQDRPDDAADAVHAENVERIVVADGALDRGRGEEAADAGRSPDPERARPGRRSPRPA